MTNSGVISSTGQHVDVSGNSELTATVMVGSSHFPGPLNIQYTEDGSNYQTMVTLHSGVSGMVLPAPSNTVQSYRAVADAPWTGQVFVKLQTS